MAEEASSSRSPILAGFSAAILILIAPLGLDTAKVVNGTDATGS